MTTCPTLPILRDQFLRDMRLQNLSPRTIEQWTYTLGRFVAWCNDRGIEAVGEITTEILAAYRRHLYHARHPRTGGPLKFATQASYLMIVRRWFLWLFEEKQLQDNPAARLELPKEEERLPMDALTADQVETILNGTDIRTPLGLRDRAMLETFYSTAIRCSELASLNVYDILLERQLVTIRQGKGRKDRLVPIGERALSWVEKYTHDIRPELVSKTNETRLFVTRSGRPFDRNNLSLLVRRYIVRAGMTMKGSCHLLRHTAATLMMERGADLRSLQELLGHKRVTTTQIYTHVSIRRLQEVHRQTHPARPNSQRPPAPHANAAQRNTEHPHAAEPHTEQIMDRQS